jgi:serine protease Do
MSILQTRNSSLILAGGIAFLGLTAAVMAQREAPKLVPPGVVVAAGEAAPVVEPATRGLADARSLSAAFRQVSKAAVPAIVSIDTERKAREIEAEGDEANPMGEGFPFDGDSPFGELFRNDPRLRDMFKNGGPRPRREPGSRGQGSGFVIDPSGIIMTNNHVVEGADKVTVRMSDGRVFVATDFKGDPKSDVAIVRIKADAPLTALPLGDSDRSEVGEWVLAVGSPFGLEATVTAGIVSAKGRGPKITEREDFIQTDAAINPGNSGGPLLNLNGEVIGMNTAISTRSGGYDGVSFAVPINMAKWVANQLIEQGSVRRAYLGVAIQPVDSELAGQFGVAINSGAVVTQVIEGSPAEGANLQPGDIVIRLDGKSVTSPRNLQSIVEQLRIDGTYPLVVLREGKETELSITMRAMPQEYSLNGDKPAGAPSRGKVEPDQPEFNSLGLKLGELTAEMAENLGYKSAGGMAVMGVKGDSPASEAGLQPGMLIERVANKPVTTAAEFETALKEADVAKGVLLLVRTPRGTQFVVVKGMPEKSAKAK